MRKFSIYKVFRSHKILTSCLDHLSFPPQSVLCYTTIHKLRITHVILAAFTLRYVHTRTHTQNLHTTCVWITDYMEINKLSAFRWPDDILHIRVRPILYSQSYKFSCTPAYIIFIGLFCVIKVLCWDLFICTELFTCSQLK